MRQPDRVFIFRGVDLLVPLSAVRPLAADRGWRSETAAQDPDLAAEAPAGPDLPGSAAWPGPDLLESLPIAARRDYPASGLACAAVRLDPAADPGLPASLGLEALAFRSAMAELPLAEASRAAKGLALLNWQEISKKCGACGGELEDDPKEGWETGGRRCLGCGRMFWPRVSPAVIVLVRRGPRILLAHNAAFPAGRFGLIAGFVEPGESLEETARRELMEEASIEVSTLRYVASQPWPFPDSLMLAFEAEWAQGEGKPDGKEIAELRWCGPDDLPSIPPPGSVARLLIDGWLAAIRRRGESVAG